MTSYKEVPNVTYQSHRLKFPEVEWLHVTEFKSRLKQSCTQIHPFIDTADGQKVYFGKCAAKTRYVENQVVYETNENVGAVRLCADGSWRLEYVDNNSMGVSVAIDGFYVLSIPDPNGYEWLDGESEKIPKYALRELDTRNSRFALIGRTVCEGEFKSRRVPPNFFQRVQQDNEDNGVVDPFVGKIDTLESLLFVVDQNGEILKYTTFAVLCLRPTPASLQQLTRQVIRKQCQNDTKRIEKLRHHIAASYVSYLEFPRYLYIGEVLLAGDRLVSQCGKYELVIVDYSEATNTDSVSDMGVSSLVFRLCDSREESNLDFEVGGIESIILQQNFILINFTNNRSFHCFYSLCCYKPCKYRINLCVETGRDVPLSFIEQFKDGQYTAMYMQDYSEVMQFKDLDCLPRFRYLGPRERFYDDLYSDEGDNPDYDDGFGMGYDDDDDDDDYGAEEFDYDFGDHGDFS